VTAIVVGVDGCRAGWVCVLRQVEPPFEERAFLARSFNEILTRLPQLAGVLSNFERFWRRKLLILRGRPCRKGL
jgi:hypothetical protein